MNKRFLCVGAAVLFAVASFAGTSEATTITFDGGISGVLAPDDLSDPGDNCVLYCVYAGTPGNDSVFTTQGYRFTALPNSSGTGDNGEAIVVNANLLPGIPDNGTDWMLVGGIVQMTRTDGSPFSLQNFQAANVDPFDPTAGQFARAYAFRNGVLFEGLHFALTPGFQTFVLPSTWTNLTSVNFSGRLLPTDNFPRITSIDNINATAVPEPASLLLLGSGLVAVAVARRRLMARS